MSSNCEIAFISLVISVVWAIKFNWLTDSFLRKSCTYFEQRNPNHHHLNRSRLRWHLCLSWWSTDQTPVGDKKYFPFEPTTHATFKIEELSQEGRDGMCCGKYYVLRICLRLQYTINHDGSLLFTKSLFHVKKKHIIVILQ